MNDDKKPPLRASTASYKRTVRKRLIAYTKLFRFAREDLNP